MEFVCILYGAPLRLERSARIGRLVDGAEVVVEIFEITRDGYHGRVVGGVTEARNVDIPTFFSARSLKALRSPVLAETPPESAT